MKPNPKNTPKPKLINNRMVVFNGGTRTPYPKIFDVKIGSLQFKITLGQNIEFVTSSTYET